MVRIISILFIAIFAILSAQERFLLRIGKNGQQEAIPLKKGEQASEVINRLEQRRTAMTDRSAGAAGLIDTLRYFANSGELTTNFGWTHQDVALQWYVPQSNGIVKEFWWYNYLSQGEIKKGTIRAWNIDPRVANYPSSVNSKYLGTYKDAGDGDGFVRPFKPSSGDQWFYSNGAADSTIYSFDPILSEATWLPGGFQVALDSNAWQGIKLSDFGDSMIVKLGVPFGFTISNDTKITDVSEVAERRMEILSKQSSGAPFHSLKFYETGRTARSNAGWWLRGDYEWGMYVVIEYTGCRAPRITTPFVGTQVIPGPREICFSVVESECGGTPVDSTVKVVLGYKFGKNSGYDSLFAACNNDKCCFTIPAASVGDTVYWYITVTDRNGNRITTPARSYIVFKKSKPNLFVYNNAGFSRGNAGLIYTGKSTPTDFDYWSSPSDGTGELSVLFDMYNDILFVDGNFPARNVYTAMKARLAKATEKNPVSVFFTSQDYGCYIGSNCADISFSPGMMEYDYFGISMIGPQDLPPTNREFKIVPQPDSVTAYLLNYNAVKGTSLWYDPTFELGFAGYPDAVTPRPQAKVLFTDGGTKVLGVKYITPSVRTAFLGFDAGALQFRSDTSLAAGSDPKYQWIADVGSIANSFFAVHHVTSVSLRDAAIPDNFELKQNYPNPFNPSTTIEFTVPYRTNVSVTIYNTLGQKIATVADGIYDPGSYTTEWNGSAVSSGLYFYEMSSGSFRSVKKMLMMK